MKAKLSINADIEYTDGMTLGEVLDTMDFLRHDLEKVSMNNHKGQNVTIVKVIIRRLSEGEPDYPNT